MKDGLFNPFFTGNYANPYSYSGGGTPSNAVMYEDSTAARYEDDEFVLYE